MQKSICLPEGTLDYELQRKRVKRLSLRVDAAGRVLVSAPRLLPLPLIERFICRRKDWIEIRRTRALCAQAADRAALREGGRLALWDETLTLCLQAGTRRRVERRENELWISLPDPTDEEQTRRAIEQWRKAECEKRLTVICRELYPHFAARGVAFPRLSFRRMKSRWGSCRVQACALSFNTRLTELPLVCAEYVAAHELTHFLHPNHSPAFYAELARVLPDWKERRAIIRAWEKEHPM